MIKTVNVGDFGVEVTKDIFDGLTSVEAVEQELDRLRYDDEAFVERESTNHIVLDVDQYSTYLTDLKDSLAIKSSTPKVLVETNEHELATSSVPEKQTVSTQEYEFIIKQLLDKLKSVKTPVYAKYTGGVLGDEVNGVLAGLNDDDYDTLMYTAMIRGFYGDKIAEETMGDSYHLLIKQLGG